VFELGGRRYGLPAADVRQLLRAAAPTPLPRAPALVKGVINLRGTLLPVLDVRGRFGLPPRPIEPDDHFIVAQAAGRLVALHVDRAVDLVRLDAADLADARGLVPGAEHLAWVARTPDDLVLIHDLATFLSRAEAAALESALSQSSQELEDRGRRTEDRGQK
jgi:purine-binding chemotaxis protein CheW